MLREITELFQKLRNPSGFGAQLASYKLIELYRDPCSIEPLLLISNQSKDVIYRRYAIIGINRYIKMHSEQLDKGNIYQMSENLIELSKNEGDSANREIIIKSIRDLIQMDRDGLANVFGIVLSQDFLLQYPNLMFVILSNIIKFVPKTVLNENLYFYQSIIDQGFQHNDESIVMSAFLLITKIFKHFPDIAEQFASLFPLIASIISKCIYSQNIDKLRLAFKLFEATHDKGTIIIEVEDLFNEFFNFFVGNYQNMELNYLRMFNDFMYKYLEDPYIVLEEEQLNLFYETEKNVAMALYQLNEEDPNLTWITSYDDIFYYIFKKNEIYNNETHKRIIEEFFQLSQSPNPQERFLSIILITNGLMSSKDQYINSFFNILSRLTELMQDVDPYIQFLSCSNLEYITPHYSEEIIHYFDQILPLIINSIKSSDNFHGISLISKMVAYLNSSDIIDFQTYVPLTINWIVNPNSRVHIDASAILEFMILKSDIEIRKYGNEIFIQILEIIENEEMDFSSLFYVIGAMCRTIPDVVLPYTERLSLVYDAYLEKFYDLGDRGGIIKSLIGFIGINENEELALKYFNRIWIYIRQYEENEISYSKLYSTELLVEALVRIAIQFNDMDRLLEVIKIFNIFFSINDSQSISICCDILSLFLCVNSDMNEKVGQVKESIRILFNHASHQKNLDIETHSNILNTIAIAIRGLEMDNLANDDFDTLLSSSDQLMDNIIANRDYIDSDSINQCLKNIKRVFTSFSYIDDGLKFIDIIYESILKKCIESQQTILQSFALQCIGKFVMLSQFQLPIDSLMPILEIAIDWIQNGSFQNVKDGLRFITHISKAPEKIPDNLLFDIYNIIVEKYIKIEAETASMMELRDYLLRCICVIKFNFPDIKENVTNQDLLLSICEASPPTIKTNYIIDVMDFIMSIDINFNDSFKQITNVLLRLFSLPPSQLRHCSPTHLLFYIKRLQDNLSLLGNVEQIVSKSFENNPLKKEYFEILTHGVFDLFTSN